MKLPHGFKLECENLILKQIEKKVAIEKLNRKLEQKAEKTRLALEEKEHRKIAAKVQSMDAAKRRRE